MTQEDQLLIEGLIDRYSLAIVLENIQYICFKKSEHIQSTWQDSPLASAWTQAGHQIGTCSRYTKIKRVSQ